MNEGDNGQQQVVAACKRCLWYKAQHNPRDLGQKLGMCLRFPPQVVVIPQAPGQIQLFSTHPTVQPDMFCGEFALCPEAMLIEG